MTLFSKNARNSCFQEYFLTFSHVKMHIKIHGLILCVMQSNMFSYVKWDENFNGDIYFAQTWHLAPPRKKVFNFFFSKNSCCQ